MGERALDGEGSAPAVTSAEDDDPGHGTGADAASTDDLLTFIYDELRELARSHLSRENAGHTLRPTDLVHEVYLTLAKQRKTWWENRSQFFAVASQAIRRILINHAKARSTLKRGGGRDRVAFSGLDMITETQDYDLIQLDEALQRLSSLDERQGRVVELKFFGGLTNFEVAEVLGVSPRTVDGEWALARSWLRFTLEPGGRSQ